MTIPPKPLYKQTRINDKETKSTFVPIENAGGFKTLLKTATDYLVIGNYATDSWIHSSYGRKIEKAVDMKAKGHHIKIISESHWTSFLD